ncbi:porin [Thalassotalea euphylliae]|uniref:Porin n=1 Tax=Thalassotalea euphylliae TaxID=1655234 RepID=A0A3E0TM26_9GAMM|nr:porin [Thalassotalea euphylliae]REL25443.1 porin [Thalassotalea euphylliae]
MRKALLSCAICAALPLASAQAEITFNGFANIVAGQASSGDTQWGYDDDVDFKQDSLFALQASTDLGEGLSATAQIISRGENDWEAEFEWAYIAYDINDNTRVLAGRQRAPLYMYSDYLDVSYAYPWITPPEGVYNLELSKFDGVSLSHNFTLGEFDTTAQVFLGSDNDDINVQGIDVNSSFDEIFGGTVTLNRDWLTLRTAYLTTDLTIPIPVFDELAAAWNNIQGFGGVAEALVINEDKAKFFEFGAVVDYNNYLLIAEVTRINYDNMPLDTEESMYVTAGYRFDDVLVHLTYGVDENTINGVGETLPVGVSPELDQLVGFTRQGLEFRNEDSSYYTLGARWDFHPSASFKVEFSKRDDDLINQDTSLVRTALVTVF